MTAPVTVPADIPGLRREGAPIAVRFNSPPCEIRGTVLRNGDIACRDGGYSDIYKIGDHKDADFPASQLVVILSESAGRDIAARWIAEKLGWRHEMMTAPMFYLSGKEWIIKVYLQNGKPDWHGFHVDLGLPDDPAQGPEAMRAIVLHLAGRAP